MAKTSSSRKRWASMTFPGILCRMIHWLSVPLRLAVAGLNSCRNLLFGKPGFAPPTGGPEPGFQPTTADANGLGSVGVAHPYLEWMARLARAPSPVRWLALRFLMWYGPATGSGRNKSEPAGTDQPQPAGSPKPIACACRLLYAFTFLSLRFECVEQPVCPVWATMRAS